MATSELTWAVEELSWARRDGRVEESRGFFRIEDGPGAWQPIEPEITTEACEGGQRASIDVDGANRLRLRLATRPGERFYGLGEQFTHLDVTGHRVPVVSQEPGIGRGVQPLTWVMDKVAGAGGTAYTSNAPMAVLLSSAGRALVLETEAYCVFDLTDGLVIEVWSGALSWRVVTGEPKTLVTGVTAYTGRMRPLPAWVHGGAIIGMQGGTARVRARRRALAEAGCPVSAFWLQDWVGKRKTSIGSQLWWNWQLDRAHYPDFEGLVEELRADGVRVLTYVNPMLVDAPAEGRRNLFREARDAGYLVRDRDGEVLMVMNTSFSAATLDLSDPEAVAWMQDVLRTEVKGVGASGWMADVGESLPFDAVLRGGSGEAWHNRFPVAWAELNRGVVGDDEVFFVRGGFTRSPGAATLFWAGDQLTSWRREDGLHSLLIGLLSSGVSGMALNHGDVGGYTVTELPWLPLHVPGIGYSRGKELLMRWAELCAFTAVLRTHEGNQPERNWQIDGDAETLAHFAACARWYAALGAYRAGLCEEAAEHGWPLVRAMWLEFPDEALAWEQDRQFCLGPDVVVAPVLEPGVSSVRCWVPPGDWQLAWTGASVEGGWQPLPAPLGQPAVLVRAGSAAADALGQETVLQSARRMPVARCEQAPALGVSAPWRA